MLVRDLQFFERAAQFLEGGPDDRGRFFGSRLGAALELGQARKCTRGLDRQNFNGIHVCPCPDRPRPLPPADATRAIVTPSPVNPARPGATNRDADEGCLRTRGELSAAADAAGTGSA